MILLESTNTAKRHRKKPLAKAQVVNLIINFKKNNEKKFKIFIDKGKKSSNFR